MDINLDNISAAFYLLEKHSLFSEPLFIVGFDIFTFEEMIIFGVPSLFLLNKIEIMLRMRKYKNLKDKIYFTTRFKKNTNTIDQSTLNIKSFHHLPHIMSKRNYNKRKVNRIQFHQYFYNNNNIIKFVKLKSLIANKKIPLVYNYTNGVLHKVNSGNLSQPKYYFENCIVFKTNANLFSYFY